MRVNLESGSEDEQTDRPNPAKPSRIISSVLTPAIRLWLKSQLDHVDDLQLTITASDRQIFSGEIQQVTASACRAIYQGLHFSQVSVVGTGIQTNLRQVLRGKAFRLLTTFPVNAKVQLSEADLNASLQAPLLANAVLELLLNLLKADIPAMQELAAYSPTALRLEHAQITLAANQLMLSADVVTATRSIAIAIQTGLQVEQGNLLKFERPQWFENGHVQPLDALHGFTISLGSEVNLQTLRLDPSQLTCQGTIMVTPAE
ncbi:LmeA family phospholipid-binding protein [Pantanalinema sp. GBBB05]|uniref:LmeA family phospholipid-binding protein n=1 Tax=Pantanalinema sp. GBBB05 TaxID=2604139 RepID=UPI001DC67613|nr:DUF2993 domain-containing protein [Pantanalinema sp. GBBB05]